MRNPTATAIRDQASRRVRRITAFAIAGAAGLTAAFTGIAAGSTHAKSTHGKSAAKRPTTTATTQKTVTAPVPSLTPNGSTVTPQVQQQPQAVTPTAQQPVAVSGGS